ncbi:aldehyde dehydrogenase (NADP(+)) [Thermoflavifilum thermophilum]|uniref:NADP-dependent aldehyde dehydrogenase n=1 Tax=Thermoflavifilum thermophilum TaxID=1393122 RepID=A0A1I7N3V3_9BACT|nr:aldehyde dehydrogenase (NADP(+)) [Thermoflavifilum thermophilum]SFV29263.1 NADP-dependent aldehyde dehydrogenase [Thermoflavifilum thermophilum]
MSFPDATPAEIEQTAQRAWEAFVVYRKTSWKQRAGLLSQIAEALRARETELIALAMSETHLPEARLKNEFARTLFQLQQYGHALETGIWGSFSIDTAVPDPVSPQADVRKTYVPLGPVAVFGASNFPFAFSTAGGDTASALAAGCTVIVKAHPAHPHTSEMVAALIQQAVRQCNLPDAIFQHIHGASPTVSEMLVKHPCIKAVGFTGSYAAGKALFDIARQRKEPIPVFAEMGSVNPVFLLPEKLSRDTATVADMLAGSITLSAGQFCTKPGLIFGIQSEALERFTTLLTEKLKHTQAQDMLHEGIAHAFREKVQLARHQQQIRELIPFSSSTHPLEAKPVLSITSASAFMANAVLHEEIFGPYALIIGCKNFEEMLEVAGQLEGQLTCTLMATEQDLQKHAALLDVLILKCGRMIFNGVPTGVRVCMAMHHGGPFPATTDSRFTSVGADAIKRFVRPICFQNFPDAFLPPELQNENPLLIGRIINQRLSSSKIV